MSKYTVEEYSEQFINNEIDFTEMKSIENGELGELLANIQLDIIARWGSVEANNFFEVMCDKLF